MATVHRGWHLSWDLLLKNVVLRLQGVIVVHPLGDDLTQHVHAEGARFHAPRIQGCRSMDFYLVLLQVLLGLSPCSDHIKFPSLNVPHQHPQPDLQRSSAKGIEYGVHTVVEAPALDPSYLLFVVLGIPSGALCCSAPTSSSLSLMKIYPRSLLFVESD